MKKFLLISVSLSLLICLVMLSSVCLSANTNFVQENYDKAEYMIPMRDGVKLYTQVYTPKDIPPTNKYPILMDRTPYSVKNYEPDEYPSRLGPSDLITEEKFIVVRQDVRGKFKSEGVWVHHIVHIDEKSPGDVDESTDAYDTVEWLINNTPNHNGRVGLWGVSYGGWEVAMGIMETHPAIKAAAIMASPGNQFMGDDYYHNGAFRALYAFYWSSKNAQVRISPTSEQTKPFEFGTPDGYRFWLELGPLSNVNKEIFLGQVPTWNEWTEHDTYDEYWQSKNVMDDMNNIRLPVMSVCCLFDSEDYYGAISIYHSIEEKNPENQGFLVLGPWRHGGFRSMDGSYLGNIQFDSKTSDYYHENIELPFFNYYLKDKGEFRPAEAIVFITGSNQWKTFDEWPPKGSVKQNLYLRADGKLSFEPPTGGEFVFDSYVSDPKKPVPFTSEIRVSQGHDFMVEDQRFASTRPDVLVYETDVLEEDITIVGPIIANLNVATSGTDCDWIVKLIDVYPGDAPDNDPNPYNIRMGHFQMLLAGDVFRSKFRNSYTYPEPVIPDQIMNIRYDLLDKSHTFLKGHRIMVQIQSSWFPLIALNPGKFCDIINAVESDFQKTTQKVYRSVEFPSVIELSVLK